MHCHSEICVTIGQYRLFVWATVVGIGVLCAWSAVGGPRSVHELWHVGQCDVLAVAMVIFRASGVTYIRRIGHARGASLSRVLQESRRIYILL